MSVLWIALVVVALQRIGALVNGQLNARRMLDAGGIEVGRAQFPLIAAVQLAWLASMALFIMPATAPEWWLLGAAGLVEIFHMWAIASLGAFWSTRVILVRGTRLVRRGPYRYVRHPNYIAVWLEIALLPLAFGAPAIAVTFAALYGALIVWRVGDEDRLLARAGRV